MPELGIHTFGDDSPILDPFADSPRPPRPKFGWRGALVAPLMLIAPVALIGAPFYAAYLHAPPARESASNADTVLREDSVWSEKKSGIADTVPSPLLEPSVKSPNRNDPSGAVPQDTRTDQIGGVTLIEIGVKEQSLKRAFLDQLALAKKDGKDVLVMTVQEPCKPCEGVMASLRDERLQTALSPVRVLKVNVEVFESELNALKISRDRIPGFYLLAADGTPRDGIDGGEWGEDIPENIAPVLGPFVRGKYKHRKQEYKPLPGGGVFL